MGQPLKLADPAATESLASRLAKALPDDASGWTVLLQGELGAGKSTFARSMLHALGYSGVVPSPTYTLVEPYSLSRYTAYHIDLYRIISIDELEYLGWPDLQRGLRLIEWPERAPQLDDEADIRIILGFAGDGRTAELKGVTDRGRSLVAAIKCPTDEIRS